MPIRSDVNSAIDRFHEETKIEVSDQAANIMVYIVSAVKTDPQESWEEVPARRIFVEELPGHLRSVVREEGVKERITTFDFLHWLSKHLQDVCPVKKSRPGRPAIRR